MSERIHSNVQPGDSGSVNMPGHAGLTDSKTTQTATSETESGSAPQQIGRYEIQRLLGRGGMGQVFLAYDRDLDRQVALKMPDFDRLQDRRDEAVERFLREAGSMASLQHPNLCPIYDVGTDAGRPFLTMAFIDGPDLARKVTPGEPLSVEETLRVIGKLARAMQVVHEAGIIHRDLKPSNVMINAAGEPIVMDFGLAQRRRDDEIELTSFGDVVGSPLYMSPEQVHGEVDLIGPHTDVYALGVMMYVMLCGRKPFEGTSTHILAKTALHEVPPPPSEFASIPNDVETVCCTAMAPLIDDRYQSAAELADAIDSVLEGRVAEEVVDVPARPGTGVSRWVIAVAGCALIAVVGWRAGAMFHTEKPEPAPTGAGVTAPPPEGTTVASPPVAPITGGRRWLVDTGQALGNASTLAAAAGDLDGDGDIDIVAANAHAASSRVWLNDGRGTFDPQMEFPARDCNDVALADLDQDGDLDIVFGNGPRAESGVEDSLIPLNGESEFCTVWLNDGHGEFQQASTLAVPAQVVALASGDLDGDGDADLILAADNQPLQLWKNAGDARFESGANLELDEIRAAGTAVFTDVVLNDFDGDGDLDLFACLSKAPNRIWWNEDGQLRESGQFLGRRFEHSQAAVADLDTDGRLDVIVASHDMPLGFLSCTDSGTFSFAEYSPSRLDSPAVAASDLNNDGIVDLVAAGDSGLTVFLRDRDFGDTEQFIAADSARKVIPADFDGDGLPDAFLANGSGQPNRVLLNTDQAPISDSSTSAPERGVGDRSARGPWPPGQRPGGPLGQRPLRAAGN